jgi:hypothetical protein
MTWQLVVLILGLAALAESLAAYAWSLAARERDELSKRWWAEQRERERKR